MDRRNDYKTALLIDAAIHGGASNEGASPARELAGMGVPFETAKRVLTKPAERRHPLPPTASLITRRG
jgi:hypothetical protein